MQNSFDLRLRTGRIALVPYRHTQPTTQQATEMSRRVCELVLLIIALVQCDEDTEVMFARCNLNRCACELRRQLIEAASRKPLFGTLDVEG